MFFRKKPTLMEAKPTDLDLRALTFQHIVLKQKLIDVNLELMNRYITIEVDGSWVENVETKRASLKESTEDALRLHLALIGQTVEEFERENPEWYA
jgi:hypothetical protein